MSVAVEKDLRSIYVRPAKVCDAPAVSALVAVSRHAGGTLEHAQRAGVNAGTACHLANRPKCPTLAQLGVLVRAWVAVADDAIVGFASGVECRSCFRLDELIVARSHRRRGAGAALLRQAIDLCEFAFVGRLPLFACVRGTDVSGLSWLCERDFEPARYADGRVAITEEAFAGEQCDGIFLARVPEGGVAARIALAFEPQQQGST
jgi:GNAT superfamily N-acetyltransferase